MKPGLAVLLVLLTAGCDQALPPTAPNVIVTQTVNIGQPSPTVSPSPAPGTPTGPSDVNSMALFNYGKCTAGNPFVLERGCGELLITATPKNLAGTDAVNHGRALTWSANGIPIPDTATSCIDVGPAMVCSGPAEFTFNRTINPKSPPRTGSFLLAAVLIAPDGKRHEATASVVVQ